MGIDAEDQLVRAVLRPHALQKTRIAGFRVLAHDADELHLIDLDRIADLIEAVAHGIHGSGDGRLTLLAQRAADLVCRLLLENKQTAEALHHADANSRELFDELLCPGPA